MKKFSILSLSFLPAFLTCFLHADEWFQFEGTHFDAYLKSNDSEFAARLLEKAETDLGRILKSLNYESLGDQWKNDRRIRILIFETQEAFQTEIGAPDWSTGHAHYETRTIASYRESKNFLTSALPHEIAHLVLFELTGNYLNVPRWLHEGFALAQEDEKRSELERVVKESAAQGKLLPLAMLTIVDPKTQSSGGAAIYYAESQAFVRFLIDRFGAERFREFILTLSKGKSFEEAVTKVYRDEISEIEQEFFAGLK